MRWYVDGMNVIGTRPDGWWKDRDAAMLRLVDQLERWAASEGEDVVVVFERKPSPPIRSTVIEVAHAPAHGVTPPTMRSSAAWRPSRSRGSSGWSPRTAGWPTERERSALGCTAPTCSVHCSTASEFTAAPSSLTQSIHA